MKKLIFILAALFMASAAKASYIINPRANGNRLTCGNTYYILPDVTTLYTLNCPGNCLTSGAATNNLLLETGAFLLLENGVDLVLE